MNEGALVLRRGSPESEQNSPFC